MTELLTGAGQFKVDMIPIETADSRIECYSLSKTYSGDLVGHSHGKMVAVRTGDPGNAGYVAIEYFEGKLQGREGSFALQHNGLMTAGIPTLDVVIIPGSATGELLGLAGSMTISRTSSGHEYLLSIRSH